MMQWNNDKMIWYQIRKAFHAWCAWCCMPQAFTDFSGVLCPVLSLFFNRWARQMAPWLATGYLNCYFILWFISHFNQYSEFIRFVFIMRKSFPFSNEMNDVNENLFKFLLSILLTKPIGTFLTSFLFTLQTAGKLNSFAYYYVLIKIRLCVEHVPRTPLYAIKYIEIRIKDIINTFLAKICIFYA